MASEDDIATGRGATVDDDDFIVDPSKLKPRRIITTTAPATAAPVTPAPTSLPPQPIAQPTPVPVQVSVTPPVTTQQSNYDPNTALNFSGNQQTDIPAGPPKEEEHWVKSFWRPAMGWLYMLICFMDFVGFPLLTIFLPIIFKPFGLVMPYTAWVSLTLSNGGLIHLAFGAILGVSAFTRGQEKIASSK